MNRIREVVDLWNNLSIHTNVEKNGHDRNRSMLGRDQFVEVVDMEGLLYYMQLAIADTSVMRTLVQWGQQIPVSSTWNALYELRLIRTQQTLRHLAVLIRQVALYSSEYWYSKLFKLSIIIIFYDIFISVVDEVADGLDEVPDGLDEAPVPRKPRHPRRKRPPRPRKRPTTASKKSIAPKTIKDGLVREYMCKEEGCSKIYENSRALRRHTLAKHEEWKFRCSAEGCGLSFPLESMVTKHERRHSDKRPYPCERKYCPISFKTLQEMRRHMKVHDEIRPFPCVIDGCDLAFKQPKAVDTHIERAHGNHVFKCPSCDKQYAKYVQLRKHEEIHTLDRSFVCDVEGCGKTFTTAYYLKTHVWKCHHAVRRYACQVCGQMYKCLSQVRKVSEIRVSGLRPDVQVSQSGT